MRTMFRALRVSAIVALLAAACTSDVDPSTAAPSPSPSPNPSPTGTASPTALPTESPSATTPWTLTASFPTTRANLTSTYVTDVVAWNGQFVAIGRSDFLATGENGDQRLWTSDDGRTWTEQDADFGTDDASLVGLALLADGRLLAVGAVSVDLAESSPPFRSMAWVSDDALAWEAVELPVPEGPIIGTFAEGAKGYAFTVSNKLWFSANGLDWENTHDGVRSVHAGDDGFVAIESGDGFGPATVEASADGVSWFTSQPIGSGTTGVIDVAALGGDWLATVFEETTISVWWSADGLEWEQVLDVNDLTGPDGPKAGLGMESGITGATLSSAGDLAVLTLSWNHCCAQLPIGVGVWTSIDGRRWIPAIEPDGVVEAAAVADVTVLAGFLSRGGEAAFWVADR